MGVLVDSSVWIAGSSSKNPECLQLQRLIKKNEQIFVTHLIAVEVCQGAESEKQFHQLWTAFKGFDFISISERLWGLSAWNFFRLRKKGIILSTIDCLFGTLARESQIPLWTLDKNLRRAAPVLGFELYRH